VFTITCPTSPLRRVVPEQLIMVRDYTGLHRAPHDAIADQRQHTMALDQRRGGERHSVFMNTVCSLADRRARGACVPDGSDACCAMSRVAPAGGSHAPDGEHTGCVHDGGCSGAVLTCIVSELRNSLVGSERRDREA